MSSLPDPHLTIPHNNKHISTHVTPDTPSDNIVKRVVKHVQRRHTISSIQKEQKMALPASERINYCDKYVIVPDSELSTIGGKKCMKYDRFNEAIWKRNLEHYQKMIRLHSRRAHSAIQIENPLEELPKPSNYERFVIHEQRHQNKDCLEQTAAILYLCSNKDYRLVDDLGSSIVQTMQTQSPDVIFFEAHQAIELARARVQATGDIDFTVIIEKLRNGFQIVPLSPNSRWKLDIPRSYSGHINTTDDKNDNESYTDVNICNTHITSTNMPVNNMQCNMPEHHNISDKVNHFDNMANNK